MLEFYRRWMGLNVPLERHESMPWVALRTQDVCFLMRSRSGTVHCTVVAELLNLLSLQPLDDNRARLRAFEYYRELFETIARSKYVAAPADMLVIDIWDLRRRSEQP
jgi:hypothetical protein